MRTTVDLPPAVHRRALALARVRGLSLSATVAELTMRGLNQMDDPVRITTDEETGFPTIDVGRPITSDDVAALLDDE